MMAATAVSCDSDCSLASSRWGRALGVSCASATDTVEVAVMEVNCVWTVGMTSIWERDGGSISVCIAGTPGAGRRGRGQYDGREQV